MKGRRLVLLLLLSVGLFSFLHILGLLVFDLRRQEGGFMENTLYIRDGGPPILQGRKTDFVSVTPFDCVATRPHVVGGVRVSPKVCIKAPEEDEFISSDLLKSGEWEADIVTNVLVAVSLYPGLGAGRPAERAG